MTTRGKLKLTEAQKCWRCRGDGYYFRVPNGCNPFLMGAIVAANSSRRVDCFECGGTGLAKEEQKSLSGATS